MTLAEELDQAMKAKERWQIEADKYRPALEKAEHEVRFWDRRATDLWRQMTAITFHRPEGDRHGKTSEADRNIPG